MSRSTPPPQPQELSIHKEDIRQDTTEKKDQDMSNVALMDIGEHCSFCGQIDFLPFKCSCSKTFCLQHRTQEAHQCEKLGEVKRTAREKIIDTSHLPSAKTLFPDRKNFKVDLKTIDNHPVTIKGKMKKNDTSAFSKLKRFFETRKKERKEVKGPAKRMVELSLLKTKAKGDSRVPATEKIHLWVQVIDDESKFDKVERHPMFISRSWPLGRALDSIASELKLKNLNNRTTDQSQRLFLFKEQGSQGIQKLETSARCNILKDGETLFVVRGTEEVSSSP